LIENGQKGLVKKDSNKKNGNKNEGVKENERRLGGIVGKCERGKEEERKEGRRERRRREKTLSLSLPCSLLSKLKSEWRIGMLYRETTSLSSMLDEGARGRRKEGENTLQNEKEERKRRKKEKKEREERKKDAIEERKKRKKEKEKEFVAHQPQYFYFPFSLLPSPFSLLPSLSFPQNV